MRSGGPERVGCGSGRGQGCRDRPPAPPGAGELGHLRRGARTSTADLARAVGLNASATAERMRCLTGAGVITGCTAVLDPEVLGRAVTAFVRLAHPTDDHRLLHALLEATPEVLEAHHVTGEDCVVLEAHARSVRDLERVTGRLVTLGPITTTVVASSPLPRRALTPVVQAPT